MDVSVARHSRFSGYKGSVKRTKSVPFSHNNNVFYDIPFLQGELWKSEEPVYRGKAYRCGGKAALFVLAAAGENVSSGRC